MSAKPHTNSNEDPANAAPSLPMNTSAPANAPPSDLKGNDESDDVMELQIIKARTMFQMLDEFSVSGIQKQLLYLTNAQAREFNIGNIDRLIASFEIPRPHIVITFPKTASGFAQWNVAKECGDVTMKIASFDDQLSGDQVFTQLVRFMKDVVIPMAADNNALVLLELSATCDSSSAFMQAIMLVRGRFGNKLPFTVLGVDLAMRFHRVLDYNPQHHNCERLTFH
jgi:hypothetical protein